MIFILLFERASYIFVFLKRLFDPHKQNLFPILFFDLINLEEEFKRLESNFSLMNQFSFPSSFNCWAIRFCNILHILFRSEISLSRFYLPLILNQISGWTMKWINFESNGNELRGWRWIVPWFRSVFFFSSFFRTTKENHESSSSHNCFSLSFFSSLRLFTHNFFFASKLQHRKNSTPGSFFINQQSLCLRTATADCCSTSSPLTCLFALLSRQRPKWRLHIKESLKNLLFQI